MKLDTFLKMRLIKRLITELDYYCIVKTLSRTFYLINICILQEEKIKKLEDEEADIIKFGNIIIQRHLNFFMILSNNCKLSLKYTKSKDIKPQ